MTVHYINTIGISGELNPFIRFVWIKWGIVGFVGVSMVIWLGFIMVFFPYWDKLNPFYQKVFYFIIFLYFLTNINHIFKII